MKNGSDSKKHSMKKIAIWAGGGVLCLLLSLFFLTPTLLSTGWGKNQIAKKAGKSLGGTMTIEDLSLSWFGVQTIKGITVKDNQNQLILSCPLVTGNQSLWAILFSHDLGEMKIDFPEYILRNPLKQTASAYQQKHAMQAAGLMPQFQLAAAGFKSNLKGYHGKVVVDRGKIAIISPNLDPIFFQEIALTANLPKTEDQIDLVFHCTTQQQQVQGQVSLTATIKDLDAKLPSVLAKASLVQLPVRGIDQIVSQFYAPMDGMLLNLIGPTINMDLDLASASQAFQLNLDANSEQFTAHLSTESSDGILSLKNPGLIKLTMPPASFKKFSELLPTLKGIVLTQPATFLLNVSELSMHQPQSLDALKTVKFDAQLSSSPASIWSFNGQNLVLQNLQMQFATPSLEQGLNCNGNIAGSCAKQPFQMSYQAVLSELFGSTLKGKGSIQLQQLPLNVSGQLLGLNETLEQFLGPTLNGSLDFDLQSQEGNLQLAATTPFLNAPLMKFKMGQGLALQEPATIVYTLRPQVLDALAQNTPVQCTIDACSLSSFQALQQLKLSLRAQVDQLPLNSYPISNVQIACSVQSLDQISFDLSSQQMKAHLEAAINSQMTTLTLKKPFSAEMVLDNALYQRFAGPQAKLTQNSTFSLSIDPFSLPLDKNQMKMLKIKGLASIPSLSIASLADPNQTMNLSQLQAPFQIDAKAKSISLSCSSQMQVQAQMQKQGSSSFNISAVLNNVVFDPAFDLSQAKVEASGNIANIPTNLLSAFAAIPNLSALMGSDLNCTFKAQSTPDQQTINLTATTPLMNVNAALYAKAGVVQLQGNQAQATWTLTPDGYQVLDSLLIGQSKTKSPFTLKENTTFSLNFSNLYLPLQPKTTPATFSDRFACMAADFSKLKIAVNAKNGNLNFFDQSSQETIQLANTAFTFTKSQAQGPIQLALSSSVTSQTAATIKNGMSKSGSLNATAAIDSLFNEQGAVDLTNLSGKFTINASQFPTRALDLFARAKANADRPFSTLFGDYISSDVAADLKGFSGPISATINSPNSRFSLKGKLLKGALLLDEPIHAQGKITTEMSRLFLKEVNPLSISYIYSQDPVTLQISNTDFYLPLYPFDPSRLSVSQARIELGQIYCRNEGNISTTLSLLKNKQFSKEKEIMLWFAPIDLQINKGVVNVERTEILIASAFDVAIWGKFNMVKDYVDMVLGLTAQTLHKAFGIKGLPENYVLTLPMKGPSDNVQIDTGKATAKLALLMAWQQKSLAGAAGGTAGAIVGEFLGKLATLPDQDAKVPPAKHPYPWETGKNSRKATSQAEGKKRRFKAKEKPLKQILKVIR